MRFENVVMLMADALRLDFANRYVRHLFQPTVSFDCMSGGWETRVSLPIILTGKRNFECEHIQLTVESRVETHRGVVRIKSPTIFDILAQEGFTVAYINLDAYSDILMDNQVSIFPGLPSDRTLFDILESQNRKVCVFLHLWETHYPWVNKSLTYLRESGKDFRTEYYWGVRRLESRVTRLFNILERYRMLRNTLVVFTSDHGEYTTRDKSVHRRDLVPLYFKSIYFRDIHLGRAEHVDILPTVLYLLGVEYPGLEGRCLFDERWLA